MDSAIALEVMPQVLNTKEQERLRNHSLWLNKAITLVFSAKESLVKSLYPRVRKYFDFSAAEVIDVDDVSNRFTLQLTHSLSKDLCQGRCFSGNFSFQDDGILTSILKLKES